MAAGSTSIFNLRWGILATGRIANEFARDLLSDPQSRKVYDVVHTVKAVGSSTSADRARAFIKEVTNGDPEIADTIAAYGSYREVCEEEDVDIVYIGSPHSGHYHDALLALNAGKHVCCEKPFTINAKQSEHLIKVAKERNLFLMEAVWTRFFPLTLEVTRLLHHEKVLGHIHRVSADFSVAFPPNPSHRIFRPDLGGGGLLDLGIYSLTWAFVVLYRHPDNHSELPIAKGTILKHADYEVDECTTVNLTFPKLHAAAVATTSISVKTPSPYAVVIQGEKGDLFVPWPTSRPEGFTLQLKDQPPQTFSYPIHGQGLFWEADACARAIRDGKTQTELCPLRETLAIMQIMDDVRTQNGLVYPAPLEDVKDE